MRREILFSVLGFLGGFVAAAMVFWQPAVRTNNVPQQAASDNSTAREAVPVASVDHSRRRLVVTARENEGVAPVADSAPKPQGAAEIFHEALGKLKGMDHGQCQAALASLVKQLRTKGPEGLRVLRDYFRAGQDVKFEDGYWINYGGAVVKRTLRSMLLDALGGWPEAADVARDVLRSTSLLSEASVAMEQLEKSSSGTYRAEVIQALQRIMENPDEANDTTQSSSVLIDAMKRLKATELLPAAESLVAKSGRFAREFLAALGALPADVSAPAIQRLFANESVARELAQDPWSLHSLNYAEPVTAQSLAQVFASNTDKRFREHVLQSFASYHSKQVGRWDEGGRNMASDDADAAARAERITQLQARLGFLDSIVPQCNTPVLQERLQDAKDAIQKALADPDASPLLLPGHSGHVTLGSVRQIKLETEAAESAQKK